MLWKWECSGVGDLDHHRLICIGDLGSIIGLSFGIVSQIMLARE